jgi:hypothetical protein
MSDSRSPSIIGEAADVWLCVVVRGVSRAFPVKLRTERVSKSSYSLGLKRIGATADRGHPFGCIRTRSGDRATIFEPLRPFVRPIRWRHYVIRHARTEAIAAKDVRDSLPTLRCRNLTGRY